MEELRQHADGDFMNLQLKQHEILLAVAFAVFGFLFSTREWLLWLNSLNPLTGLLVYYAVLYLSLYVLSKLGLTIFNVKITTWQQTFGLMLITFAFFVVVDWTSAWVQYVTTGSYAGTSVIFLQDEDGAVFYIWQQLLPTAAAETLRVFTYVITPLVMALIGGLLVDKKIKLG